MLVWAATKKVPRDALRHNLRSSPRSPSSLLPSWLCPSQQRYLQSRWFSALGRSALKPKNTAGHPKSKKHNYSTATPPFAAPHAEAHAPARSDYIQYPFQPPVGVTPIDPTKVIILGTPEPHEYIPRNKDKNELLALFSVCLSAGHLVRADRMLDQMTPLLGKDSPVILNAYNLFLEALVERANESKDLKVLFMWYEDKMKSQFGITGDAMTFAFLLKASLRYEQVKGQEYLNQYIQQWRSTGCGVGDVLVNSVLTTEEVIKIAKICSLKVSELHESHRALIAETVSPDPSREFPEIKSVTSRGHGLAAIQRSVRSLVNPAFRPESFSISGVDNIALQVERQRLLEEDAWRSAQERWRKDHEAMRARGVLAVDTSLNSLLWEWHQSFVPLIVEELARVRDAESDDTVAGAPERCLYGPFLRMLPPEKIAAIVMVELLKVHNSSAGALKVSRAVMHVGNMLEAEYLAQEIQSKDNKELFAHVRNKENLGEIFRDDKFMWKMLIKDAKEHGPQNFQVEKILPEWPVKIKAKLGAVLLTMLLHCAKTPVSKMSKAGKKVELGLPAFGHTYRYVKGRKLGLITLDTILLKRLGTEDLRQGILGRLLPMVIPPREWRAWNSGGYYYTQSKAVRTKSSREQTEYVKTASKRGDLKDIFASLDVLGKTAWKINKKIFDIVVEVWNSEEAFGAIPPAVKDLVLPPEPEPNIDPKVRFKWLQKVRMLQSEAVNNHSQRCSVNFKIEIARAFLFDKFYFPHNMDFRGRAYPIPPSLNHIGDDLSRGLLQFDTGKELGENGLRWLKIHLANLCGADKISFDEREQYANENIEHILDSANDPLGGKRWWLTAEDQWQCLATCMALKDAIEMPDPSKYVCHIPVAQDGTCNGLQHYAALGGDMMGAQQVNLVPAEKPSDVYTGVAELVRAAVRYDAENGNEMAEVLKDKITRKVVKQTVMTNVYGVTFIGAKEQIKDQLSDNPDLKEYRFGHPKFSVAMMSTYLTHKVFESISTMFFGASKIQHWLGACAKRISLSVSPQQMDLSLQDDVSEYPVERKEGASKKAEEEEPATTRKKKASKKAKEEWVEAEWAEEEEPATTRKKKASKKAKEEWVEAEWAEEEESATTQKKKASTKAKEEKDIHFMTSVVWTTPLRLPVVQPYRHDKVQLVVTNLQNVYITDPSVIDEINARKQMMAFPPNFIHSLDATHMLMSARKCYDEGLTFASVHDSFWTHPSDVDTLNRVLREAFIELHSGDVMNNLKSEFEVRYEGYKYLASVYPGSPISSAVKNLRLGYAKKELMRASAKITMLEDLQWERQRDRLLKSEDETERKKGEEMITPSVLVTQMGGLESLIIDQPEEVEVNPGHPEGSDHDLELDTDLFDDRMPTLSTPEAVFSEDQVVTPKAKNKATPTFTRVWMPLVFPELPPKGDFKVEDLRGSQYFFS